MAWHTLRYTVVATLHEQDRGDEAQWRVTLAPPDGGPRRVLHVAQPVGRAAPYAAGTPVELDPRLVEAEAEGAS